MQASDESKLDRFWKARLFTHGHTGWADGFVYAFDQPCRLLVFSDWLKLNRPHSGKALDFGCGSGDFSRFLINKNWHVVGYDKYVSPKINHPNFQYTGRLDDLPDKSLQYDLVFSITVLDCIMDDKEFINRLVYIRKALKTNGKFFFIEYSPQEIKPRSSYQAFRTMETWKACLQEAGLNLQECIPFFHPQSAPIPAWRAYAKSLQSRSAFRLTTFGLLKQPCQYVMRKVAKCCLKKHAYASPNNSPINLFSGNAI